MTEHITIEHDGTVVIGSVRVRIPNVRITSQIGVGANGVVLRGLSVYLRRPVAVKFWLTMNAKDARDKFQQGIWEARKAAEASTLLKGINPVVAIYDAGRSGRLILRSYGVLSWRDAQ